MWLSRDVQEIFESFEPATFRTSLTPSLDMYQEKDELVIKTELPGIKKGDVNISLEGDTLTLEAEKKPTKVAEEATFYRCKRCFGRYSRCVSLPFPVDAEKASATFKNGLLEIRLPKAEAAKTKHIEVQVR